MAPAPLPLPHMKVVLSRGQVWGSVVLAGAVAMWLRVAGVSPYVQEILGADSTERAAQQG